MNGIALCVSLFGHVVSPVCFRCDCRCSRFLFVLSSLLPAPLPSPLPSLQSLAPNIESFLSFESKFPELVAVSSSGQATKNKVDFWDQEREQMSVLTRASEIAPGVWVKSKFSFLFFLNARENDPRLNLSAAARKWDTRTKCKKSGRCTDPNDKKKGAFASGPPHARPRPRDTRRKQGRKETQPSGWLNLFLLTRRVFFFFFCQSSCIAWEQCRCATGHRQ